VRNLRFLPTQQVTSRCAWPPPAARGSAEARTEATAGQANLRPRRDRTGLRSWLFSAKAPPWNSGAVPSGERFCRSRHTFRLCKSLDFGALRPRKSLGRFPRKKAPTRSLVFVKNEPQYSVSEGVTLSLGRPVERSRTSLLTRPLGAWMSLLHPQLHATGLSRFDLEAALQLLAAMRCGHTVVSVEASEGHVSLGVCP